MYSDGRPNIPGFKLLSDVAHVTIRRVDIHVGPSQYRHPKMIRRNSHMAFYSLHSSIYVVR